MQRSGWSGALVACVAVVRSLLLALVVGGVLSTTLAQATSTTRPAAGTAIATAAQSDGEADEIQLDVAGSWKLKDSKVSGTVTNNDRSDITGTAKLTARPGGKTVTIATGGPLDVAVGQKQTLSLKLTQAGKSLFKRHTKAKADLLVQEHADTRSGDLDVDVEIHKAK